MSRIFPAGTTTSFGKESRFAREEGASSSASWYNSSNILLIIYEKARRGVQLPVLGTSLAGSGHIDIHYYSTTVLQYSTVLRSII